MRLDHSGEVGVPVEGVAQHGQAGDLTGVWRDPFRSMEETSEHGELGLACQRWHFLVHTQAYRPAHWRVASEKISRRRLFDVNDLTAIRMEHP